MTKLSSSLPKGDANGLGALARHLINDPGTGRIIIAVVDCKSITTDMDSGDVQPTARIRHVEWVQQDEDVVRRLLTRAMEERTGKAVLPFILEEDLRVTFAHVDPATGEVLDGGDES